MKRIKYTTNINAELIERAKQQAEVEGLDGANAVIEAALRLYFANRTTEVWEKVLDGGWIKKIIVRPGRVVIESIRSRQVRQKYNPRYFTDEVMQPKGWTKVWKMKSGS